MGPVQKAQHAEIRHILRSTGAQAKLTVGQPNDKYEKEADRVADQVMRMPDLKLQRQSANEEEEETVQAKQLADQITPLVQRQEEPPVEEEEEESLQTKSLADQITPLVQRQEEPPEEEEEPVLAKFKNGEMLQRMCPECEEETAQRQLMEEEDEELQAKSNPGETPAVTPSLESRINGLKGGSQPLDRAARSFFELRFGYDFSQVRVHTGANAEESARDVNAKAFTLGRDVMFGGGQFDLGSKQGKRLLAHELTHVVQQEGVQCSPTRPMRNSMSRKIVPKEPTEDTAIIRRKVSSQFNNIIENMSYSGTDWAITEEEAQEIVTILKHLGPVDLQDTLDKLKNEEGGNYYRRLIDNLPEADFLTEQSWLMPPHPQVGDAADSLGRNSLIMDSYVNFRSKTWSWYFSKNASLKPYHKKPDQFNSWVDWDDLASSQTGIRKRMVIANLGGFDNNSFRSINRNNSDLQKLISGFNRWPNDWYAIFQSSEEKATNTCNIFVGESLFIAGKNTVKGDGKYHSAEEVYDGDGPFIQIEPGAFSRGDIDANGSHTDVIVSVTPGTGDFTARNGYRRGIIRPRNLKDWRILRLA
ncbi:MAG: eCIS core domain-containing protein [Planctomycetota bacterium]|jgi:hypothetical protein